MLLPSKMSSLSEPSLLVSSTRRRSGRLSSILRVSPNSIFCPLSWTASNPISAVTLNRCAWDRNTAIRFTTTIASCALLFWSPCPVCWALIVPDASNRPRVIAKIPILNRNILPPLFLSLILCQIEISYNRRYQK